MGGRMGSGQSKPTSSTFFWVCSYCLSASFIQAEHTMCGPPRCISRVLKLTMCMLHTPSSVCMCVQQALGKKLGWLHILWPPENTPETCWFTAHMLHGLFVHISRTNWFANIYILLQYSAFRCIQNGFKTEQQTVRKALFAGTVKQRLADAKK